MLQLALIAVVPAGSWQEDGRGVGRQSRVQQLQHSAAQLGCCGVSTFPSPRCMWDNLTSRVLLSTMPWHYHTAFPSSLVSLIRRTETFFFAV